MQNIRPPLPDSLLSSLSDFLAAQTGLYFPKKRWGDLERGIVAAACQFGLPDAQTCARWLLSAPLTRSQIEVLASHLTVGETYFFREQRSFEALEQHILPVLLHAREHTGRRLRIWSAGCSTGEEAYSIAMLLDRLIPDPEKWNVTILATDINPAFLGKAAAGMYGEWSFRDTPAWIRARHFKHGKNARFEILPRIRKRVTFSYLNLADDVYPSLTNNTNAMDVIFCRNVLMYFTAAQAQKVIENLHRSLVDGGWLIVSPAETSISLFSRFTAVGFPGAVLYRKPADAESPAVATAYPAAAAGLLSETLAPESLVGDAALATPLHAAPLNLDRPAVQSDGLPPCAVNASAAPSRTARACANQGKLAEAAEWCGKAIAADKLNPAHLYLLATIRQEQGQYDRAVQSLMRALYLDPDFVLAHFALGNLRLAQDRRREAERHFRNALALLHQRPRDEILPESDGLSAGRLVEIITSVLSSLPCAATVGV
ncbi:protein-glutamate O-methyltransferase [Sulfuriferula plumbiphila]|uniref:Protein-glutamate O-methyltransferase n=1 Tax=Sulfuriferula plumbiphila TaxID=171865 RepID=A0A512L6S5_9PROT|nr:protein-glutamate O-methyltransferase CheR [Sulfuriferula plumbiphila]BBP04874.1 protein-glutamate O-methyltransferase [Sulfuriferula plumbiphila]GEP30147.1 protein-glutamate O-methyltransferase [Sulfuriferula plumbiphila]